MTPRRKKSEETLEQVEVELAQDLDVAAASQTEISASEPGPDETETAEFASEPNDEAPIDDLDASASEHLEDEESTQDVPEIVDDESLSSLEVEDAASEASVEADEVVAMEEVEPAASSEDGREVSDDAMADPASYSEDEQVAGSAESEIEEQSAQTATKPNKKFWLLRFFSWVGSLFRRRRKNKQAAAGEEAVLVLDAKWAKRAESQMKKLRASIEKLNFQAENIQQQTAGLQDEQVRVENWMEGLQRSYYWKVEQRMEANLDQAKRDIVEYEGLVKSLKLPEKGTLQQLREKFHKGMLINFLVAAVPVFLLYFIPWFSRVNLVSWLIEVLRSPLFWVIVATIGAVVAGTMLLLRRVLGKKRINPKRTIKSTLVSVLIPLAFYGLWRFQDFLRVFVTPIIESIRPTALWVILILFVFATLAILMIYYQGWSVFRRQVTEQVSRLQNVAAGYVKTKQEMHRLEFLYSQVNDWMRLIAHSLYRPWKVHPDWKSPNQAQVASESFPMALRVAQAVENDASESAQLNRTIASRLLVQGWRAEAFEKSLSQIGRQLGYEPDKINPELLEADLPHQPNNARKLVLGYFEHSAETASQGLIDSGAPSLDGNNRTKPNPDDRYLVEVARDQLNFLIDQSQSLALSEARPSVQQVVGNPLAELAESSSFEQVVEISEWNDYLSEGLGIDDPTQPPLGILAFTDEGRKSRSSAKTRSVILAPERLAPLLPAPKADGVELVVLEGNSESQPAEVMLRFDFVGPVPPNHVTLVQNTKREVKQQQIEEVNDDL